MSRWLQVILLVIVALTALLLARPIDTGGRSGLPDRYSRAELDKLIAMLHGGQSEATDNRIHLRGVVESGRDWNIALDRFRAQLPDDIELVVDVFVVDESLPVESLCERMFAGIRAGPVEFLESGTEIRTSSYAALDRMASFTNDCPMAFIEITGHSDSTGYELNNRKLSRARAQAVADYLVERGALPERLLVKGAGSAEPIADNSTAIGRERNRRIEFSLRQTDD